MRFHEPFLRGIDKCALIRELHNTKVTSKNLFTYIPISEQETVAAMSAIRHIPFDPTYSI
jgi:hypothetical protein